jgi:hypothetical protein
MVIHNTAAVPVRDGRGHGSACARAVGASTRRDVGTSVTARTPNACGSSGAGRRPNGRPSGGKAMRSKLGTLRPNGRDVGVPHRKRKHRRTLKLPQRVVTQQKFFRRLPCATDPGATNLLRSQAATRRIIAVLLAGKRFAECGIVNASGCGAAVSKVAALASGSTRPPAPAAAARATTPPGRGHHDRRRPDPPLGRAGLPALALPRKPHSLGDDVCAVVTLQEFQA